MSFFAQTALENLFLGNKSPHNKPGFSVMGDIGVFNNLVEMLTLCKCS